MPAVGARPDRTLQLLPVQMGRHTLVAVEKLQAAIVQAHQSERGQFLKRGGVIGSHLDCHGPTAVARDDLSSLREALDRLDQVSGVM